MNNSTLEEVLVKDGVLYYSNVGDSMLPLIKEGLSILEIKSISKKPQKYDIVLYKRNNGQYVLHRILKVRKNDYVMCGDNRWTKEKGIVDNQIIGILTKVINGEKITITNMNDKSYRIYSHLWCDFFLVRAFILKMKYTIKKWT